ncbi:nickel-dependent lactate racemase [Clostridium thermosuccinogenes]|uniref:nickel-dependent lactate racemase n=1 Tax=Clostridium thermosuccinogenes TaxID=84032 RepID=UPI000CCC43C7|nr:nickel-dependent lactate racemase [Pseudoclostridium thermosuccinogenes]PNT92803.1 transcriptional regulator [Pseudoclostridium thermosuccinogenes]
MHFKYGYGKTYKEFDINDENILMELRQNHVDIKLTGADEVKRALDNPIGTDRLSKIIKPGEKVAIITSDITRPMPSKIVLPLILEELKEAGVKYEDITVVFALGSHRKHTEEEKKYLVGEEVYNKVQCVDSDPSDFVHMGVTSRGTPVDIFSAVAKADRRICLGNIEFHYFAGYSGGAKAIMPGVSTRAAIQANHSAMVKNEARAGAMDDNPVRLDIEEVVQFVPIDFILNVVLDEKKNIIKAVAGHHVHAHREGCKFLDSLYKVEIPQKADIVITTPGGYPKDINLYQAQKALDNSKHAVRDGGIVILLASCTEGLGEEVFERWLLNADSPDSMISDIQKNFELGGHKAAAIALVQKKAKIYLVSDLEKDFVRKLFMEPFDDISEALESAFNELGQDAKVLLMPYGGSTLPFVKA